MAEVNFVDGQQLTPSSFGSTNDQTGVWQPIAYTGTYGANGFYLPFSNTASTSTLGYDFSGNSNNWTTNNISLTSGTTYDSMNDVPTQWIPYNTAGDTGALFRGNYCVQNPLTISIANPSSLSNGNLKQTGNSGGYFQGGIQGTMGMTTGKFYWETTVASLYTTNGYQFFGVAPNNYRVPSGNDAATTVPGNTGIYGGSIQLEGSGTTTLLANNAATNTNINSGFGNTAVNDVIQIAFDVDSGKIWFGKNNTWYNSGVPASGTNPTATLTVAGYTPFMPCNGTYTNSDVMTINYGQQPFAYTPPSGFKTLNTTNLPTPTIGATASTTANEYFDATTYTGNGSSQLISNSGSFQPNFVWIKERSAANQHNLMDVLRTGLRLRTDDTAADSDSSTLFSFASTGFNVLTSNPSYNGSAKTYVAWQWKASDSGVSNTNGSITSTVSASTTAGFSIVTYTGNSTVGATIGHGLGVAPQLIIIKSRSNAYNWVVGSKAIDGFSTGKQLYLNTDSSVASGETFFANTQPTSSVFSVKDNYEVNFSGYTYVAYCFAPVAGYSAFGTYTGNGSSDGPFIFTGFRPRYVMIKRSDSTADWNVRDTARSPYNVVGEALYPNLSLAEYSGSETYLDILSNGFKLRGNWNSSNASGGTYIYMAFAESPFKYSLAR